MSTDTPRPTPGRESLAEIGRILDRLSPADDRDVRLRDLLVDAGRGMHEVYLILTLLDSGRASCSPDALRRLSAEMREAAGSIDMLLDTLARG